MAKRRGEASSGSAKEREIMKEKGVGTVERKD
jgi:hypothetical protein